MRRTVREAARPIAVLLGLLATSCIQFTADAPPPFYTPPSPLPAGAPGSILRSEPITADLPSGAVAYRVLYHSTGLRGEPAAVSGFVLAPAQKSDAPRPVIAWAHGSVGVLPECNVTHTAHPYGQLPRIRELLAAGFVIASSDYLGLGTPGVHPYLDGELTARSIVDSVRAARALDVGAGDRYVVWGASQGGHAALWTAQTAASYAPELELLGAAASAPAVDLAEVFGAKLSDDAAGVFLAEVLYSWSNVYGFDLGAVVLPEKRAQVERIARTCISVPAGFLLVGGLLAPRDYLRGDLLSTEPWKSKFEANSPWGASTVPLLLTHGIDDALISVQLTATEATRRCTAGEDVQLVELPGVAHDGREEAGPMVIAWALDRFAGRPTTPTCAAKP